MRSSEAVTAGLENEVKWELGGTLKLDVDGMFHTVHLRLARASCPQRFFQLQPVVPCI